LGIEVQRIYKWRKAAKTATLPKAEKPMPDDALELKRLRKALKEKELELEILKRPSAKYPKTMFSPLNIKSPRAVGGLWIYSQ